MVAQEVPTSSTMALPHGPTGVAEARRRMRGDLYAQDVPETVIDDAVLILSELLSNSCRHARPLGDPGEALPGPMSGASSGGPGASPGAVSGTSGAKSGALYEALSDTAGATAGDLGTRQPQAAQCARQDAGGIRAGWSIGTDGLLKVEVTDGGGPTRPRPSSPSLTARGGRGLGIVDSLALRWGVRDDAQGQVTVWALLPVRGRHARRDDLGTGGTGIGLPRGIPLDLPLDLAESLDDLS
ncbi:ATP-binding protein [Streptomyces sp. NBC_01198]|uniref:ATP-binding protein n=1 Tax=Streptomyces sp. NBC_01198 TaxID=2903769 RepID=UPI002E14BEB2|nr:ATP-binding protein [Streptomyces sp. NBC_01198]